MAQPKVKVRFELEGEGEARAGIRRTASEAENAADRIDKRFKDLGDTLKALGIGALIGKALGFAISQTVEAEKVNAALEARLKSLGGTASSSKDRILELAAVLQSKTTFEDDAITQAATSLLAFTNIDPSKFDKALGAVLDVSTAKMIDLGSAADIVGKALNEPSKAMRTLRELGVELDDSQQKLIQSFLDAGEEAKAQQVILDELTARYDGAAVAARDTFGGAIEALKVSLGNLVEGGPDTLTGARQGVEELNRALNDPDFKDSTDKLVAAIFDVIGWVAKLAEAFVNAGETIGRVFGFIAQEGRHAIDLNQALLSADVEGVKRATAAITAEYARAAKEQDEMLRGRKEVNTPGGAIQFIDPPKPPPAARFKTEDTITIHAGDGFGSGKAADRAAKREAERAAREALRLQKEQERAAAEYKKSLEDLRAEIDGPLAQAQLQYERRLDELNALAKTGKVGDEEQTEAKKLLRAEYEKTVAAIEKQLDPAAQLLDDMRFELSLLGLTNAQRRTAIQLRQLDGKASAEQAAQIAQLNQEYEDQQKGIDAMDNVRQAADQTFADIITGSKSALDAVKSFFDAVAAQIAQLLAQQLTDGLFGAPGTQGSGPLGGIFNSIFGSIFGGGSGGGGASSSGGGGILSSIFSSIFGGGSGGTPYYGADGGASLFGFTGLPGFALGGNPPVGSPYWVGEKGPELRIDRHPGTILPMDKLGMGGGQQIFNVSVPSTMEYRTAAQIAQEMGREVQRANARRSA